jgi:hypothetical protein
MKNALAVFFFLTSLAMPGRTAAQSQPDPLTIHGAVVSSGNTSFVIDADDGTKRTFLIDTTTKLPTAALTPGSLVAVQYQPLDAERAQAVNVSIVDPAASSASTAPADTPAPTAPNAEQSRGPLGLNSPVPFLGVAGFGLAVVALLAWVFTHRRDHEMTHISL